MSGPPYDLLWQQYPSRQCPGSGALALSQEAVLQLTFAEQTAALRLSLGGCADEYTYLAALPLLEAVLAEVDYSRRM